MEHNHHYEFVKTNSLGRDVVICTGCGETKEVIRKSVDRKL